MIRALIERRIREGAAASYEHMLRDLRFEALRERGYLTGETWRDIDDPQHYVVIISTWQSCGDGGAWLGSDARRRVPEVLAPLVLSERITLYEHA